jgi:hypothetical protein
VDQWLRENRIQNGAAITMDKLVPHIEGNMAPICPTDGTCGFNTAGAPFQVTCSVTEHNNSYPGQTNRP